MQIIQQHRDVRAFRLFDGGEQYGARLFFGFWCVSVFLLSYFHHYFNFFAGAIWVSYEYCSWMIAFFCC